MGSPIIWFGNAAKLLKSQLVLPGSTSGSLTVQPAAATTSHTLTAPSAQGASNTILNNDGAGALSWVTSPTVNQPDNVSNLGLSSSVGSNLLTVNLKQADGSTDPAAGSGAVTISFRNSTLATGAYLSRTATAALSISTVATGASFGTTSAVNQYIYVYAIDNAGTIELALAGSCSFDESLRFTTTAIGAGSTSSTVLYSTTSRSNVAVRMIGRLTVNEATAGTYASAATEICLLPLAYPSRPFSEVYVDTGNGMGATNTKIRRWTTTRVNVGSAITYADSSTLGGSFTINENGIYSVFLGDSRSAGGFFFGVSVNASGTVNFSDSSVDGKRICLNTSTAAATNTGVSGVAYLRVGDVVRAQYDVAVNDTTTLAMFRIAQLARI